MKYRPKYLLLDSRMTVGESMLSDGWTFGLLLLCIWASQDSKWWTFFTAGMFLSFTLAKVAEFIGRRQHSFKSVEELEAWVATERASAVDNAGDHAARSGRVD